MLLDRASETIVERRNAVEAWCFSERREKVISIGLARGGTGKSIDRKREKEGERRFKERLKDRERRRGKREGPMDRRGTASASSKNASPGSGEVLGPARFSRVRSALGKATFFFAVFTFRVLSRGLTSRFVVPSCFVISSYPLYLFVSASMPNCLRSCARFVFIPR